MSVYRPEDAKLLSGLPHALLPWFDRCQREMPWRGISNSYHTWVSEIMLQQTRVEAVRDYFLRFISALPDPAALAACEESVLLKLWEGLGYYNRVRNLQKAARIVVEQYDGSLPTDYAQLLTLPGIGEYTAGAIASIAFGIPVPCVDGNVLRVIARITANATDISLPVVKQECRELILGLMPHDRPGDFNQSLMELGATVCLPGGIPLCGSCPAAEFCRAHLAGEELAYPVKAAKAARKIQERTIQIVLCEGKLLLMRRADSGLLSGMWEFPGRDGWPSREELAALLEADGFSVRTLRALKPAKHIFSHIEWRMHGFLVEVAEPLPIEHGQWVTLQQLREEYALPSAFSAYSRDLERWMEV